MTIGGYLVDRILYDAISADAELLNAMRHDIPATSPCGVDVQRAIDGFNAIAECERMAHGEGRPPKFLLDLARGVVSIANCFIFG